MSEEIVRRLLENDQVDPKAYALRMNVNLDDDTLRKFKSQATNYIKWICGDAYEPGVGTDIANAGSFDEVAQILALYDEANSGIGFLDMIRQGYF